MNKSKYIIIETSTNKPSADMNGECKDCQIETLTSQVIRLKALCGELWRFQRKYGAYLTDKDYGIRMGELEQRLHDEGVVK